MHFIGVRDLLFLVALLLTFSTCNMTYGIPTLNTPSRFQRNKSFSEATRSYQKRQTISTDVDMCASYKPGQRAYGKDPESCTLFYRCVPSADDKNKFETEWWDCGFGYQFDQRTGDCEEQGDVNCDISPKEQSDMVPKAAQFSSIVVSWCAVTIITFLFLA